MSSQAHTIPDDLSLLKLMVEDSGSQPAIYQPGAYWLAKTKNAVKEIKKFGLGDFRGASNSIGTSFADNFYCDARTQLNFGLRRPFKTLFEKIFPFNNIFNAQVALTRRYGIEAVDLRAYVFSHSPRTAELLKKYRMPISTAGGCIDYCEYNGQNISHYYLNLLDTHATIAQTVDFTKAKSFFEIGGGFGVNVHLLVENYPNLRKFVYLDIPPNLYTGTQYLKSFYGDKVRDYRATRALNEISFSNNDELEILCIAPWQIEKLKLSVDIFYNAHSFVEMTPAIVQNYAKKMEALPNSANTRVVLVSYDNIDACTVHPETLKGFFTKSFTHQSQDMMPDGKKKNFLYISNA